MTGTRYGIWDRQRDGFKESMGTFGSMKEAEDSMAELVMEFALDGNGGFDGPEWTEEGIRRHFEGMSSHDIIDEDDYEVREVPQAAR